MNKIGLQVKHLREYQGLTQEQFAARCNLLGWDISRGTLAKIEARVRRITDEEVFLLSKALKVPINELFVDVTTKGQIPWFSAVFVERSSETIRLLSEALDVPVEDLFSSPVQGKTPKANRMLSELYAVATMLDEDHLEIALAQIKAFNIKKARQ